MTCSAKCDLLPDMWSAPKHVICTPTCDLYPNMWNASVWKEILMFTVMWAQGMLNVYVDAMTTPLFIMALTYHSFSAQKASLASWAFPSWTTRWYDARLHVKYVGHRASGVAGDQLCGGFLVLCVFWVPWSDSHVIGVIMTLGFESGADSTAFDLCP